MKDFFTLREAADFVGCGLTTIRSRVQSREIRAEKRASKHGRRWEIPAADVYRLRDEFQQLSPETREASEWSEPSNPSRPSESSNHSSAPSERFEGSGGVRRLEDVRGLEEVVPSDVHIHALNLLERAQTELRRIERQKLALEFQLQKERLMLAENAESLIERQAMAKEALAREEVAQNELEQARQHEIEAEERAREAMDKLEEAKIKIAKMEAEWSEKRKPWWKKMFGTG